jgi:hypothetical protein
MANAVLDGDYRQDDETKSAKPADGPRHLSKKVRGIDKPKVVKRRGRTFRR